MAHATPQVMGDRLIRPDRRDKVIEVGTASWFDWLEQATTFAFVGVDGRYTARKERAGRTGWYWKAYRMERGKLRRAYLGKSSELTLERLLAASENLAKREPRIEDQELARDSDSPGSQFSVGCPLGGSHLLTTKLTIPPARPGLVSRPRLIEQLISGVRGKLTVLLAPAGYGKTTVLVQGMGDGGWGLGLTPSNLQPPSPIPRSVAWLSLDADDNDPLRFWSYLIAALDGALRPGGASFAAAALSALQAPYPPPITAVLTELLNALSTLTADIILILDDYHTIEERAIHQALSFMIERLPAQLHLVLATRIEPPLPLGRLRVRGELVELRIDDLRFTAEEIAAFLTQVIGLPLSSADLAALEDRTEGWAAALQLAALTLRGRSDLASGIAGFKGSHRLVIEYVRSEVLDPLPPELQRFVMQTAILERMCGPLCDAVLGTMNEERETMKELSRSGQDSSFIVHRSSFILEELDRANLFIVPLDDERTWYRYHPLFVEVARERLRAEVSASELAALHQNASAWYEAQEMIVEAIEHALAGGDTLRAAALIECHGLSLASGGSAPLMRRWLDALPEPLVQARPALCLYQGLALIAAKQLDVAEERLHHVERGIATATSDDRALDILAQVTLARAAIARCTGDLARCVALSQRVMLLAPQLSATAQAEATLNLARAYQLNGDAGPAAKQLAEQTIALLRRSGTMSWLLAGIVNLARLHTLQGRLRAALATYAQATETALGSGQLPDRAAYHAGLAEVLRERNQLATAANELHHAMALMQAGHLVDADVITQHSLTLARLRQTCGDREGALAVLDAFADLTRQQRFVPLLLERGAALRARLCLAQGNLLAAVRWADTADIHLQDPVDFAREDAYLTFAHVRIVQWRAESSSRSMSAVLDLLDRLLVGAEAGGRVGSVIVILIVRALALQAQNNLSGALVALARALVLAREEGYIHSFVDEGAPMLALLREAYARSIVPDYVEQLLHAFPQTTNPSTQLRGGDQRPTTNGGVPIQRSSFIAQPLEALTTREREVLQLIAQGASNAEIAHKLTLSLGTVKRYTNNIFGKLNVQSRTQAVLQAHRLRLL